MISLITTLLFCLGLVTSLILLVFVIMYIKDDTPEFNSICINIVIWATAWGGFYLFTSNDNNREELPYDYIIDLNHNHIDITTDDGRTLEIHPDSLQSFIEKDNL